MSERDYRFSSMTLIMDAKDLSVYTQYEQEAIRKYRALATKRGQLGRRLEQLREKKGFFAASRKQKLITQINDMDAQLRQMAESSELERVLELEERIAREEDGKQAMEAYKRRVEEENARKAAEWRKQRAVALEARRLHLEINQAIGVPGDQQSKTEHLVSSTVFACRKHFKQEGSFLSASNITCIDTVLFACFLTRAFVVGTVSNRKAAELFSDNYVSCIISVIKKLHSNSDYLEKMIDNRFSLYDEVFDGGKNIEKKIPMLIETFELVIKTDVIRRKFEIITTESPRPILGYNKDILCTAEIKEYYGDLIALTRDDVEHVRTELQNLDVLAEEKTDVQNAGLLKPESFFESALQQYHVMLSEEGLATKGVIAIPELIPIGSKMVLAFLQDSFFKSEFGDNPSQYYYVITSFCFHSGIIMGAKWYDDFDELNDEFVTSVVRNGTWSYVEPLAKKHLGLTGEQLQDLGQLIFKKWVDLHEPYWQLEDPREYTFNNLLACYQLGISTVLGTEHFVLDEQPSIEPLKPRERHSGAMYCRKCGEKLIPDSAFCSKCGTKIETIQ